MHISGSKTDTWTIHFISILFVIASGEATRSARDCHCPCHSLIIVRACFVHVSTNTRCKDRLTLFFKLVYLLDAV